jgi:hypothetical protein
LAVASPDSAAAAVAPTVLTGGAASEDEGLGAFDLVFFSGKKEILTGVRVQG